MYPKLLSFLIFFFTLKTRPDDEVSICRNKPSGTRLHALVLKAQFPITFPPQHSFLMALMYTVSVKLMSIFNFAKLL